MSAMMTLHQATQWMPGARLVGENKVVVLRVHTDTRTVEPGDLFVALQGERYDANEFLQEAQQRGAVGVVCHAGLRADLYPAGLPRIEVADTKAALQSLATTWRARFTLPVIAVTGSNGKTTVTQMLAAILDAQCPGGGALATRGNFNNDIGVPLTLLRLRAGHRMAVVELGMNHPGEIATLAAMAQPTVALVNNAQREHLEFMQTVQAVARENGSVIASLPADGVAVVPADDEFTALWQDLAAPRRCVRFALSGGDSQDEMHCVETHWEHGGWQVRAQGMGAHLHYRLSIAGRHNVKNSLAAAACALAAGVSASAVEQGLQAFQPVKGRSRALEIAVQGRERTLVDDTYNASVESVLAGIDALTAMGGYKVLVFGDMKELGEESEAQHARVGHHAREQSLDAVLTVGEQSRHTADAAAGRHFDNKASLFEVLAQMINTHQEISILVKGARGSRMEDIVEMVKGHQESATC